MPYYSGAVATERSSLSFKMPGTTSGYSSTTSSSYRTGASDRPYYSSSTGSYTRSAIPRSLSIDTKSTYSSGTSSLQNRTSSLTSSRHSSLSEDSGISSRSSFSSQDRDSRESSVTSTRSRDSATKSRFLDSGVSSSTGILSRRTYGSSSSSPLDSDFLSKYSPANYVPNSDIGRPPLRSVTTPCLDSERASAPKSTIRSRNRSSATEADPAPTTGTSDYSYGRSSRGAGLAVGGCAISERRVRNKSAEEVITSSKNNNNEIANKEAGASDEDTGSEDSSDRTDNNDDNGNERQLSVAEIRRRFDAGLEKTGGTRDSSGSASPPNPSAQANGMASSSSSGTSSSSLNNNRQNGFGSSRTAASGPSESGATRFSPSPNVVRKVYSNPEREISSSDDESEPSSSKQEAASSGSAAAGQGATTAVTANSPASVLRHRNITSSPNNLTSSPKLVNKYQRSSWLASDDSDTDGSAGASSSARTRDRTHTSAAASASLGLVGIRNLGNTCFMNSVVQCLSNTKPLKQYLLDNGHLNDLNTTNSEMKGSLIKAFATVIQELWDPNATIVSPNGFKSQIGRFAPRFNNYNQQDAQEFLRYLLEGLHEDVNRVRTKPMRLSDSPDNLLSNDQKAAEYWKRYLRFDNSKIVDIFVGQLCSTLRCTVCQHSSLTFDPFWDLSLPLPTRTGTLKLQQCFEHFTKEEVLDGDEKPTCAKCQMRRKCTKSLTIQKFPKILVLHLKRFSPNERYRAKLSVPVTFPLDGLDLSPFAEGRDKNCTYRLYGIANHSGTTYSGHYMAYCKHPVSGDWHQYNDTRVSSISTSQLVSSEAYLLFYEQTNS